VNFGPRSASARRLARRLAQDCLTEWPEAAYHDLRGTAGCASQRVLLEQPPGSDVLDGEEDQLQPGVGAHPDAAGLQPHAKLSVRHQHVCGQSPLRGPWNLPGELGDVRVGRALARAGVDRCRAAYAGRPQRGLVGRVTLHGEECAAIAFRPVCEQGANWGEVTSRSGK
jgi:hypothetical protein